MLVESVPERATVSSTPGPDPAPSARSVLRGLIGLYVLGSFASVAVYCLLLVFGVDFTWTQWFYAAVAAPIVMQLYLLPDIALIRSNFAPIGGVLEALDRGETPEEKDVARAIVQALNLPYLSFLRVTFFHGPTAGLSMFLALFVLNEIFGARFATWQIVVAAVLVPTLASPAHAVFEFFAIGRYMEPTVNRLWALGGDLDEESLRGVITVRLRDKLLYLAVFITALPLVTFAALSLLKVSLLFSSLGVAADWTSLMPFTRWILGVLPLCVLGAFLMSILTAADVTRSTQRLVEAMTRVEQGDLDVRLRIAASDESADLYRGFNLMTEALREEVQILELSQDLAGELQLDPLIAKIMRATTELLDADRSTLFVYDPKTDELWTRFAEGLGMKEIRIRANAGIAGDVFTTGMPANIPDPYDDARFNPAIDMETGYRTESILCMPITTKNGERIGVTQVLNKQGGRFTAKDESRLRAFSAQISVAVENAKLFDEVLSVKNHNESILKSTSDAILTLDEDRAIVSANDAAVELLGRPAGEIVGLPAADVFGPENAWVLASVEKVAGRGRPDVAVDADLVLAEGKKSVVNSSVVPLIDAQDVHLGTMLVLEDVSSEKRLKSTMARYMSKEVADQLLEGGEAELVGKLQNVTILFSDIRGFTSMSEVIGPRETVSMLNEYFAEMVEVVFEHHGILDKYIGDAIMALYGAPFRGDLDADNAIVTANEMLVRLRALNVARAERGRAPIDVGVGVSTGEVIVGNIGSPKRMEYTAVGDSVNLASRLEGATKVYGARILLSEDTLRSLKGDFLVREIDRLRVKGRDQPVAVYEALDHYREVSGTNVERSLDAYIGGLASYRKREWRRAIAGFEGVLDHFTDDRPTWLYIERCRHYLEHPPPDDWDGVWVLTEK